MTSVSKRYRINEKPGAVSKNEKILGKFPRFARFANNQLFTRLQHNVSTFHIRGTVTPSRSWM